LCAFFVFLQVFANFLEKLKLRWNFVSIDTLTYWKHNEYRFPVLARMARDYLCIQGTSTSVERLFSAAGNVITEKRNRIGAQTASALLCLGSWYKEQELKEDPIESPRNEGKLEKDVVIINDKISHPPTKKSDLGDN
jgi:hypothetical protein